jgi:T6SS, Transcription factor, DNA binding domain
VLAADGPARLIQRRGTAFRLHILEAPGEHTPCVVLPLDQLFEVRATAAIRLWRGLTGRSPGRNPAELPPARRERLILALRALDGRLEKASYRDIAEALFGSSRMPDRGWKTHDIRDRTVRLARLGFSLMQGGYRRLLLYPYRDRM